MIEARLNWPAVPDDRFQFACPLCHRPMSVRVSAPSDSPRGLIRGRVASHLKTSHTGLTSRTCSLLADQVADAAREQGRSSGTAPEVALHV